MCVWSAYAGTRPAAPLLWEALQKTEGIWGGYYTGVVTLDCNGLHHGKCVGHSGVWRQEFNLDDFSGSTGMIHSRTDSGGDYRFAHPFVGSRGKVAAVSQGSKGIYGDYTKNFIETGNRLLGKGRRFLGADFNPERNYSICLADGSRVPLSEIVTEAVEEAYERSGDPVKAMRSVCAGLPEESATIFLFADRPEMIGFVNVNQHVVYHKDSTGVFMSVSALGLPGFGTEIPGNTVGTLSRREIRIEELAACFAVDGSIPAGTLAAVRRHLREHPGAQLGQIADQAVGPLWGSSGLQYRAVASYRALETLFAEGEIRFVPEEVCGHSGAPGRIFRIFPV